MYFITSPNRQSASLLLSSLEMRLWVHPNFFAMSSCEIPAAARSASNRFIRCLRATCFCSSAVSLGESMHSWTILVTSSNRLFVLMALLRALSNRRDILLGELDVVGLGTLVPERNHIKDAS